MPAPTATGSPVAPAAFADLVRRTRTHRRFKENVAISRAELLELVDLARLAATATNLQPLKSLSPSGSTTASRARTSCSAQPPGA